MMRKLVATVALLIAAQAGEARAHNGFTFYAAVGGHPARVDVELEPGASPATAVALTAAHATVPSNLFTTGGFVWAQFFDRDDDDDDDGDDDGPAVTQYYAPAREPLATVPSLLNAQRTWSSVEGSSFRFAYGGTTTRCPSLIEDAFPGFCDSPGVGLDGFNDVGWGPLPGRIVGVAVSTFSFETGEAIEVDVGVNTRFVFSTEGGGVDLESVLLHENGHVAGLDHTSNPDAVMFPNIAGDTCPPPCTPPPPRPGEPPPPRPLTGPASVRRVLTATDADGLRFLYPEEPRFDVGLLAELGQEAPGGGTLADVFELGAFNDRGEAAFVSNVPEGQALFVASRGRLREIARSGQTVDGFTLGVGTSDLVGMNDNGDVAFAWLGESPGNPFGTDAGLFLARRGSVRTLLLPGAPAPGGGVFHGFVRTHVSDGGDVAFSGVVDGPAGRDYGVFVLRRDGSVLKVARPGDLIPGGEVVSTSPWSIADNGDVGFTGVTEAGEGAYVWRARSGTIDPLALPGDPAPGGGTFFSAFAPWVNARGDVLFRGIESREEEGDGFVSPLYLERDGVIETVAGPGDVLPDGWRFLRAGPGTYAATLNGRGEVAFIATIENDDGLQRRGVYAGRPGSLSLVARSGSVLPGLGAIETFPSLLNGALIGSQGNVAFHIRTAFPRFLLLEARGRRD